MEKLTPNSDLETLARAAAGMSLEDGSPGAAKPGPRITTTPIRPTSRTPNEQPPKFSTTIGSAQSSRVYAQINACMQSLP